MWAVMASSPEIIEHMNENDDFFDGFGRVTSGVEGSGPLVHVCPLCGQTPRAPGLHPWLGVLSAVLLLAAPTLWGAWIWSGDGRLGWLSLPVLFAALVVFVAAFSVEPKGDGR